MAILQLPGVQRTNGAVYNWDMTEIELKTFGERVTWLLRRRRQANQDIASQKELAAKIGMKPQQLNAYMNGRRAPNVRHLRAIAAALETSVSFLALTSNNSEPDSSEVLPDEADVDLAWASTTNTIANELDRWPEHARQMMLAAVKAVSPFVKQAAQEKSPDAGISDAEAQEKLNSLLSGSGTNNENGEQPQPRRKRRVAR